MNIFGESLEALEKESLRQQLNNMNAGAAALGQWLQQEFAKINARLDALEALAKKREAEN